MILVYRKTNIGMTKKLDIYLRQQPLDEGTLKKEKRVFTGYGFHVLDKIMSYILQYSQYSTKNKLPLYSVDKMVIDEDSLGYVPFSIFENRLKEIEQDRYSLSTKAMELLI